MGRPLLLPEPIQFPIETNQTHDSHPVRQYPEGQGQDEKPPRGARRFVEGSRKLLENSMKEEKRELPLYETRNPIMLTTFQVPH